MEMLINGRTVMIRDAIFHNHATGKPVFFPYKLKSVVYNALLSAGKLPLMVDYIYNIRNVTAGKFLGSVRQSALNAGILVFCSRKYCTSSGGTSREWWLCSNETFYSESRLYEELLDTCRKLRCK